MKTSMIFSKIKILCSKKIFPASVLSKSIAGRYRPVSYPDGPITARYRFIKNAYWVRMAEWLVLRTSEHEVPGSNPATGKLNL